MNSVSVIAFLICSLSSSANQKEGYSLFKTGETYLCGYRQNVSPFSNVYKPSPLFVRLIDGETFLVEQNSGTGWGYFFNSQGNLQRTIKRTPTGSNGKPGAITGVTSIFTTPDGEFGTCDLAKRVNFFNSEGRLTRSLLVPCFNGCSMRDFAINKETFAFSAIFVDNENRLFPRFIFLDYNNTHNGLISKDFRTEAYPEADSKGIICRTFISQNVATLSSGQIACNVSTYPDIYLVSPGGKVINEDAVPPHYKALRDAQKLGIDDYRAIGIDVCQPGNNETLPDSVENWLKTWTNSYGPYEYQNNTIIVPRVLYPVFYLDYYSYSDTNITYLGYVSTRKPFLFADSSGIYLQESKNDTLIVVGKYLLKPGNYFEVRQQEWTKDSLRAEEALGTRKIEPSSDTSDTCEECPDKIQYCTDINSVTLLSANGVEYLLTDSLSKNQGHVLIFATPQDCRTRVAMDSAVSYAKRNAGFDYALIYTHPYPEELKEFVRLKRSYASYPILTNADKAKLRNVVKSRLSMLVISRDGTIIEKFD